MKRILLVIIIILVVAVILVDKMIDEAVEKMELACFVNGDQVACNRLTEYGLRSTVVTNPAGSTP